MDECLHTIGVNHPPIVRGNPAFLTYFPHSRIFQRTSHIFGIISYLEKEISEKSQSFLVLERIFCVILPPGGLIHTNNILAAYAVFGPGLKKGMVLLEEKGRFCSRNYILRALSPAELFSEGILHKLCATHAMFEICSITKGPFKCYVTFLRVHFTPGLHRQINVLLCNFVILSPSE